MSYKYGYDYEEKKEQTPKLKTDRNMWKLMIFHILTFGIYSILFFIPFSFDLDKVAPKKDRSKTMNYIIVFVLSLFTFSIVIDVWFSKYIPVSAFLAPSRLESSTLVFLNTPHTPLHQSAAPIYKRQHHLG